MRGNTFGTAFRITTFGESHGAAIGGVVDGCPAGLALDLAVIQAELDRRRPGSTPLGTPRNEPDRVEFLSGLWMGEGRPDGKATALGTPIAFIIRNRDHRPEEYAQLKDLYRPGHADRTWDQKFGLRDHRGGGRSSARETASRVVGGAIARQLLDLQGIRVQAFVSQVGDVHLERAYAEMDLSAVWQSDVRCPDPSTAERMIALIEAVRADGDSVGGRVSCVARGVPAGLGEPVFDKLHADLGRAMLGINAVKGFQIGSGFGAAGMRGSLHNDAYAIDGAGLRTASNRSGGVQGGISNGEDIVFDVAFKPPSTIRLAQAGADRQGRPATVEATGRHDPCVVPRAVPVVEAMACIVLADHLLRNATAMAAPFRPTTG
jgi:chorismate synthase